VVECVVNVVFCVVVFGLLKTRQSFEIYFWVFLFWELGCRGKGIPQGLKPLSSNAAERTKPEGLAYLEAEATATTNFFRITAKSTTANAKQHQIRYEDDNNKSNDNSGSSRFAEG
jgi:hypothetical protein